MQWIYQTTSLITTGLGFLFLSLSSIKQLQKQSNFSQRIQSLSIRWATFIGFISIQFILLSIMSIIPFGSIFVFVIKIFVILPQNRVSRWIFDKIRSIGQRIVRKQSSISSIIKQISVFVSVFLLIISNNLIQATGIAKHKTVQAHLKNSSTFLKNREEQNIEKQQIITNKKKTRQHLQQKKLQQPEILTVPKIKVHELVVKQKKFQISRSIQIQFTIQTNTISFIDPNTQTIQITKKLQQIRYISQDLIKLQLVLDDQCSYPIELMQQWQIEGWMKPVIKSLKK